MNPEIETEQDLHPMARGVQEAYRSRGEEDEAMEPMVLVDSDGAPVGKIKDGDPVIFYDLRGEREIQLTRCFTEADFDHFDTGGALSPFVTMIEYKQDLGVQVAYPPENSVLPDSLGETLSKAGKRQARVAESEKGVHVTYFLNGKSEIQFEGEERFLVESHHVANVADEPDMKAAEVAATAADKIRDESFDFIAVNIANGDVIGHIEDKGPILQALNTVDTAIGTMVEAGMAAGVDLIVTADHGLTEKWLYPEGTVDTGHTNSPVPFIYISSDDWVPVLRDDITLVDLAPSILEVIGVDVPDVMTGKSVFAEPMPEGRQRRVALIIADGWGHNEDALGNCIHEADTPVMDSLMETHPWTTAIASGLPLGMPEGSVGNSECGHMHIGAGRVIYSDRVKIDRDIESGGIKDNEAFLWACNAAVVGDKPLHLLGIVSFYSSHGSLDHLFALMDLAKERGVAEMYIHSLLGRRGERPEAGVIYVGKVEEKCAEIGLGRVVTVLGRYWALDREHNWDRIEKAYRSMTTAGAGIPVPDTSA